MLLKLIGRALLGTLVVGCTPTYTGYHVEGAAEFVLDSFQIGQGRFAIPTESIGYVECPGPKVELVGAVRVREVPIESGNSLYMVLAQGGILPSANLATSYVIREGEILQVNLFALVMMRDMSQNIALCDGDQIHIAALQAPSVMVIAKQTQTIPVLGDFISLREVLHQAGIAGVSVQVIRGNPFCPKIYQLSWNHVACLREESLLLLPGDIVTVEPIPIIKRFLPSE